MKALVIASVLFFSLRAMSAAVEVGENKKSECPYANQTSKREAKVVDSISSQVAKKSNSKIKNK